MIDNLKDFRKTVKKVLNNPDLCNKLGFVFNTVKNKIVVDENNNYFVVNKLVFYKDLLMCIISYNEGEIDGLTLKNNKTYKFKKQTLNMLEHLLK